MTKQFLNLNADHEQVKQ